MKLPTLLCIDTKAGTARLYLPTLRFPRTFITQEAQIYKLDGVWQLGSDEGLALLEAFRVGRLHVEPVTEKEYA